jgi:hypothetical protein
MSSLCKCNGEPGIECPVIGHPLFLHDRTAGGLILAMAGEVGQSPTKSQVPVFFQDVATGRIFQIDAVMRETSEIGDTIFLKGEEY